MRKFSKKHTLQIAQKVEAWIGRCYCLKKGSLSASTKGKSIATGSPPPRPPLAAALISFSLAGGLLLFHVHTVPCTRSTALVRLLCVLLGGEDLSHC